MSWGTDFTRYPPLTPSNPLRASLLSIGTHHAVAILTNTCRGDLNRDRSTRGQDLATLLAAWGSSPGAGGAGINDDGTVDGDDLAALLSEWGECSPSWTPNY